MSECCKDNGCNKHKHDHRCHCENIPENAVSLADLEVGTSARVLFILQSCRAKIKYSDMGIVPGIDLKLEAKAPFGGLLRVKILDSSLSLHKSDAKFIFVETY